MSLYDALLDAGDRLIAALAEGDLDAAGQALGARNRILDEIEASAPPLPVAQAVERFRRQDSQLCEVLRDQLLALAQAAAATGRVAAATQRYGEAARRPALLDTVPR